MEGAVTVELGRWPASALLFFALCVCRGYIWGAMAGRPFDAATLSHPSWRFTDEELLALIYLATGRRPDQQHFLTSWAEAAAFFAPAHSPRLLDIPAGRRYDPAEWISLARYLLDIPPLEVD